VFFLTALALGCDGCANFADFSLPPLPGGPAVTANVLFLATPVLTREQEADILNPSVVRDGATYYNFYSAFDGHTWFTALATSPDGTHWNKQGRVLSPGPQSWESDYIAANGSALRESDGWLYWYQSGERGLPRIGLARSRDGRNWTKVTAPVLPPGPRGAWDEKGVADPYVLKRNGEFYIYYLGQNRARQQQIGLARSSDGEHWVKSLANPVLRVPWPGSGQADENGLGEPAVWQSDGWYWMIYTGRNTREQRSLMTARSSDGVHWEKLGSFRGQEAWDREVVCDPTVLIDDGRIRLWFGGGDRARPDENLDGQIGEGSIGIRSEATRR